MSKTRVANKTQWALRDIAEHIEVLQRNLEKGLNGATAPEAVLGIFSVRLGTIERIARLAKEGKYSNGNRLPESQRVHDDDRPGDDAQG